MTRTLSVSILFCTILIGLSGSPAVACLGHQPTDRTTTEVVKPTQKPRATASKPASAKTVTAAPKPAATATAKATDKPGKRFWSRIMGCFRDVHSVEKKTGKE